MKKMRMLVLICYIFMAILFAAGCDRKDDSLLLKNESSSTGTDQEHNKKDQQGEDDKTSKKEENVEKSQTAGKIFVYICGQVKNPGVYELDQTDRIVKAIELAGGLTKKADETSVNQAATMEDGQQIYIPAREYLQKGAEQDQSRDAGSKEDFGNGNLISINHASKEELMSIPGIGEAKASSIIAYREEHGSFSKIEDLMNISGIKDGVFAKMKEYITL
ncbi:MAG: helix-hairpin-helix domain-containing protein [Lachnospiraceae bacterium]|nr:helix-hairpin-helix domain-containing protein [Lachnospiraceae bacterium]